MSLLSYTELVELMEQDVIMGITEASINSSSIDLTLGRKLLVEAPPELHAPAETVFLSAREAPKTRAVYLGAEKRYYSLEPGEFVLAHTEQTFFLPNTISTEYKLKSSLARPGLEHLNAGWCDAGWNSSVLTLELKNMNCYHNLVLELGMPIGQMVFFKHTPVPPHKSYALRGRYNGDNSVSGVKL